MEHLLGMIADIASSVWQFALNLPGALQIVFTLVALIVAGVCRMVAMRLSHPAFTETDGSAVGKKSSRSSPTSSWSCVCLPVCSDWQPCSRHSSALLDQPIHDQGSESYDLPYDSDPCLVLSDTILRQRTHRS